MEPIENAVIASVEQFAVDAAPGIVSHILADAVGVVESLADEVVEIVEELPSVVSSVLHVVERCVLGVPQS